MAPAHPHATGVAVYPALFQKNFKNSIGGEFKKKTEKKNVGFLFYFLSMKKAVTSKLLMWLSRNLKY